MSWRLIEKRIDGEAWLNKSLDLAVIQSWNKEQDGKVWQHVSVSRRSRIPTYDDLKLVKTEFIGDDREAYQVFPAKSNHVNIHEFCLHLWSLADGSKALPDFTNGSGMI